MKPLLRNS